MCISTGKDWNVHICTQLLLYFRCFMTTCVYFISCSCFKINVILLVAVIVNSCKLTTSVLYENSVDFYSLRLLTHSFSFPPM
jgi:hypothetical protein